VCFEGDDVSKESAEALARRGVIQVPEAASSSAVSR